MLALLAAVVVYDFVHLRPRVAPAGSYDLAALHAKFSQDEVRLGEVVKFEFDYTNRGEDAIPARTWDIELWVGDEKVAYRYAHAPGPILPEAGPGLEADSLIVEWAPLQVGTFSVRLVLDPFDRLPEIDESNNEAAGVIQVLP